MTWRCRFQAPRFGPSWALDRLRRTYPAQSVTLFERGAYMASATRLLFRSSAILIESLGQDAGNVFGVGAFNLMPMEDKHRLTIAEQCDSRRGRRNTGKQFTDPLNGFEVGTGEHGSDSIRPIRMIEGQPYAGPGFTSRATAD